MTITRIKDVAMLLLVLFLLFQEAIMQRQINRLVEAQTTIGETLSNLAKASIDNSKAIENLGEASRLNSRAIRSLAGIR